MHFAYEHVTNCRTSVSCDRKISFIQSVIFSVFVLRRFAALMLHIPGKIIHSATSDARLIDFMNVASQAVGRLKNGYKTGDYQ